MLKIIARERAAFRGYKTRRDSWGKGLCGRYGSRALEDLPSEVIPIFIGLLGEQAVANYTGGQIDTSLRRDGDKGIDLVVNGLTMQLKTRRGAQGNTTLVRRVSQAKRIVSCRAMAFASCQWDGNHVVHFLGWVWSKELRDNSQFERSKRANHWNLLLPDACLLPPARLRTEIELRAR